LIDESADEWSAGDLWIFNNRNSLRKPAVRHFYIADDQPYGAQELFRFISPEGEHYAGAPGLRVSFVHPEYMKNNPEPPEGQGLQWSTWFTTSLSIREQMRLTEKQGQNLSLSEECLYVAKHRPEKFLGFLSKYWTVDGSVIIKKSELLSELL
jgi:hypothetical protein